MKKLKLKLLLLILALMIISLGDIIGQSTITWDTETVAGGLITREIKPSDDQLYPRDSNNEAKVSLSGEIDSGSGSNEVIGVNYIVTKTDFSGNVEIIDTDNIMFLTSYEFDFSTKIHAELSEYEFIFEFIFREIKPILTSIAKNVVCGDVYLIAGQSNASAVVSGYSNWITFNNLYGGTGNDPDLFGKYSRSYGRVFFGYSSNYANCGILDKWGRATVIREAGDCRDFYVGAWGLYLSYKIQKEHGIPTCIINGALGGTSLEVNLPGINNFDLTTLFGNYNYRIYMAGVEDHIKGILWYQGESEWGSGVSYDNFQILYEGWMLNYNSPFPKVYVYQISPNAINPNLGNIMEELRLLPSIFPDLEVMSTNGVGDRDGNHFLPLDGYTRIGGRLFKLLERDWYCKINDIEDITPPQVQRVYYEGDRCIVEFDQLLDEDLSDNLYNVWRCMSLNIRSSTNLAPDPNPKIDGNKFTFIVADNDATHISYLNDLLPEPSNWNYECYLRNSKNVGALAFNIPITFENAPRNTNSLSFGQNYSYRDGEGIINDEYASGRLCGTIDYDVSAFDIFSIVDETVAVFIPEYETVHLKAAHTIIFNTGFKAPKNSYMKAEVGSGLFAFTPNNYCSTPSSKSRNFFDEVRDGGEILDINNSLDKNNTITIYPNPSCGQFFIKSSNFRELISASIFDANGTLIKRIDFSNGSRNKYKVDLNGNFKGIYFIRIITEEEIVQKKIVIL